MKIKLFFVFLFLFFFGCNTNNSKDVVAKVNNTSLTFEEVWNINNGEKNLSEQQVKETALNWVNEELLFQDALKKDLEDDEKTEKLIEESKKRILINALIEKEINSFTEEMVEKKSVEDFYKKNAKEFSSPSDLLWISFVVVESKNIANELRATAIRNKNWENTKKFYSDKILSQEDSVLFSESSLYLGDAWKVGKILNNGEVSFPIQIQNKFFVFKRIGFFSQNRTLPVGAVEKEIRKRLAIERRNTLYSDLLKKLKQESKVSLTITK